MTAAVSRKPVYEVEFLREGQSPSGRPMVVGYVLLKHARDSFRLPQFRVEMEEDVYQKLLLDSRDSPEKLFQLARPPESQMLVQRIAIIGELEDRLAKARLSLKNLTNAHSMCVDLWHWTAEVCELGIQQLETPDTQNKPEPCKASFQAMS